MNMRNYRRVEVVASNRAFATAYRDLGIERRTVRVDEPYIRGTGGEGLDVVV